MAELRRVTEEVMGMPITLAAPEPGLPEEAVADAFSDLRWVDRTFSPFIPESAVSLINRGEIRVQEAPAEVLEVLDLCARFERLTNGCFSAWVRGRLDPSGLVKGWAIDRVCSRLERSGAASYMVDAGGDIAVRGGDVDGPWRVGVRHPLEKDKVVRVVEANDLAVATSGTYEKGDHILDPRTGLAATTLLSFTVIGPDILQADVFATSACVMGWEEGLRFLDNLPGYEGYAIDHHLVGHFTRGFARYCTATCGEGQSPAASSLARV